MKQGKFSLIKYLYRGKHVVHIYIYRLYSLITAREERNSKITRTHTPTSPQATWRNNKTTFKSATNNCNKQVYAY